MTERLSPKEREECSALEAQHPGVVWLELATRDKARLHVVGEEWVFIEDEGAFYLSTKWDPKRTPATIFRLAFLRAREAVAAVRQGHREAVERKRQNLSSPYSKETQKRIERAKQKMLPLEHH